MDDKETMIQCPKCGALVMKFESDRVPYRTVKCRNCNHLVVHDVLKNKVFVREVPKRTSASGMRLY